MRDRAQGQALLLVPAAVSGTCPGRTDHHDVGTNPAEEVQMGRCERRRFTDEFKAEVVCLVRSSGKSIPEVSQDLDLTESAVRAWVQRAETQGSSPGGLSASVRPS